MCGILGYISKTNKLDKNIFENSLDRLRLRGPNSRGIYEFTDSTFSGFLGHTRLSILDLSNAASQPMEDVSKNYVIVFNGEIYNFIKIKVELENLGYKFKSTSDTEILVYGYIHWGKELLQKIEGMFSFAILDKLNKKIFIARDHVGEKPLYYYYDKNNFIFSSEIKSIKVLVDNQLTLNNLSLYKYLFYSYIPGSNTIYNEILKLKPGHFIEIDLDNLNNILLEKYWFLENIQIEENFNENLLLDELDSILSESIKSRLISDVNVGVFLSGGLDSSLVAYYASKFNKNIESFSLGYRNIKDESDSSKFISNKLGLNYNLIEFHDENFKFTKEILDYLDDPISDPAIIPLYFLSKHSSKKATVFLSGDGGDELFGGYEKYKIQYLSNLINHFKFIHFISKYSDSKYKKLFENLNVPFHIRQFILGSGGFNISELDEIKKIFPIDSVTVDQIFEDSLQELSLFKQNDSLNKSLYLDCKFQLPDWYLVKADRATMAASIELRSPLVDKNLMEYSFKISGNFKLKKMQNKYLLKKLAERFFPKEFIYRKKQGFVVDINNINKFFKFETNAFEKDPLKKFRINYLEYFLKNNF